MKEILGDNLEKFFDGIYLPDDQIVGRSYKGKDYEVWSVPDVIFEEMCNMEEEKFVSIAGEDAWWRSSDGSVLWYLQTGDATINGRNIIAWIEDGSRTDGSTGIHFNMKFSSLTEYLCDFIGASTPQNVCACAMDLAKYNNMSMGKLFELYEG